MQLFKDKLAIDFMGKRFFALIFSSILVIGSITSLEHVVSISGSTLPEVPWSRSVISRRLIWQTCARRWPLPAMTRPRFSISVPPVMSSSGSRRVPARRVRKSARMYWRH